jgi:hypothetical protein
MMKSTVLTDRFDRALLYATHVHSGQVRKKTTIPYVAHLLAVSARADIRWPMSGFVLFSSAYPPTSDIPGEAGNVSS